MCAWCRVPDTREHKLTSCSKYDHVRGSFSALFQEWEVFPKCFQIHGIVPANPWLPLVWEALLDCGAVEVDRFSVCRQMEPFQIPATQKIHLLLGE